MPHEQLPEADRQEQEVQDLARAMAETGTVMDEALLRRLLSSKREVETAMAEGRPFGIRYSFLTPEENLKMIGGGFTPAEREELALRTRRPD